MLRTVHFHGALKRRFKRSSIKLDADTVAEAMRGCSVLLPGFSEYIRERQYLVTVANDTEELAIEPDALLLNLGKRKHIHVVPAAQAAGLETILIVGLVLTAAISIAAMFLLRPKVPDANSRERKDQSYIFGGPVNSTEQGNVVPLIYGGPIQVGSIVVSAGITTTDVAASAIQIGSGGGYIGSSQGVLGGGGDFDGRAWYVDRTVDALKGGKGGGGGTRSAEESPNTLRSQATVKIVDLVGEGEIGGLVNGLKSAFLDGTPVQNADDSFNFSGYSLEERLGLPDQDPMAGFAQQETGIDVNQDVIFTTPIVRTVSDPVVDLVRVTMSINSLFSQDTTNGNLNPTSVQIAIDHQSDGGGYTEVVRDTIQGKTNSPYQRSYDVRLDGPAPHNIRVRRITPDSELASLKNETVWDSYFEIVEAKLTYPDSALYGVTVDAKQFGSNIPVRSYEVYGLVIDIPSNYNPVTRVYTGIWDGTFTRAVCNNPAWILYDIIKHKRYGLGARVPITSIDKYGLYAVAQYCDEFISDGQGGTQPRYTINAVINSPESAYNVLASIASAFRGFVYWGSGSVFVAQDRPEDPSLLVTPSNVVDGMLAYQTVIEKQKLRSVAIVYWNDPDDDYKLTPEIVEDDDLIRRFGWEPGQEVVRFGCTNRAEAHYAAKWILDDQKYANKALKYDAADDHSFVHPGSVVSVVDPKFTTGRRGGRVKPGSTTTVVNLDNPVTLVGGQTYTLRTMLADGSVGIRVVSTGAGTHASLTLSSALASAPLAGSVWGLESNVVANRQFRIRTATTDEPPYSMYAVVYDPLSHARVEQDIDLTPANFMDLPSGPLVTPSNLAAIEFLLSDGTSNVPAVQFSWQCTDPRVLFFQVRYKRPTGDWETLEDSSLLTRVIRNSEPGTWGLMVRAVDGLGRKTAWALGEILLDGQADDLPEVTGLSLTTDASSFTASLAWNAVDDMRPMRYEIFYNPVDNFATASSLGLQDTLTYPVTFPGFYWVRTRFMQFFSDPVKLEVDNEDLPAYQFGITGYITNESHTVPADASGNVTSYTGASGNFKVDDKGTDVSSNFTLSVPGGGNPQGLTVGFVGQAYSVTAGLDAGEDVASLLIRATGTGAYTGIVIDKVFSLSKSKAGSDGSSAKIIVLTASSQTFKYDASGAIVPQTITFEAVKQNTSAVTGWALYDGAGTFLTSATTAAQFAINTGGQFTAVDPDTLTMSHTQYASFLAGSPTTRTAFRLDAYFSDGTTQSDTVSVVKVQDGANPPNTWYAYADSLGPSYFNFTTGAPGGRTYQGIATGKVSPVESTDPNDYTWSPYIGPPNFGLAAFDSNSVVSANKLIKVAGGNDWNASIHSTESFKGGASVAFVVDIAAGLMVGLNTDPTTNASYDTIDFAIYITSGAAYVYESGAPIYSQAAAPVVGDVFSVTYNGKSVVYSKNGVPFYTNTSPAADLILFLDSSLFFPGNQMGRILSFTGVGKPGDPGAPGDDGDDGISPVAITVSPSTATVNLDKDGQVKSGQLPINFVVTAMQAGNPISLTSLTITDSYGGTFSEDDSKVTLSALSDDNAQVQFTAVAGGQTIAGLVIAVATTRDGAGGASATINTDATLTIANQTSYTQVGNQIAMNVSSAGKLKFNFSGMIKPLTIEGYQWQSKIQYSLNGGSTWVDVTGSAKDSSATFELGVPPFGMRGGTLSSANPITLTGLTADAPALIRAVVQRKSGSATASGTISGVLTLYAEQVL